MSTDIPRLSSMMSLHQRPRRHPTCSSKQQHKYTFHLWNVLHCRRRGGWKEWRRAIRVVTDTNTTTPMPHLRERASLTWVPDEEYQNGGLFTAGSKVRGSHGMMQACRTCDSIQHGLEPWPSMTGLLRMSNCQCDLISHHIPPGHPDRSHFHRF